MLTEDGEVLAELPPYETTPKEGPFFKTPHNFDRDLESESSGLVCNDPSKTQQQFARDADINVILAKFLNAGELSVNGTARYGDAPEGDLQDYIVTSWDVHNAWEALPAAVRNILKDPQLFTEYVEHCIATGDLEPLKELGLTKQEAPQTAPAEPAAPTTTDPEKVSVGTITNK